jgi:hypothetical protein
MTVNEDEPFWPVKRTCEFLDCSPPFLYDRIREGKVRAYKVGGKTMVDPKSARAFRRSRPLILAAKPPRKPQVTSKPPHNLQRQAGRKPTSRRGAESRPAGPQ